MEKLEQPLWIVEAVNAVLGPLVKAMLAPLGFHFEGAEVIPPYLVMVMLIFVAITGMCLVMRSRLSVENPGRFQILLEDGVMAIVGLLEEWIGPDGRAYLPLIATLGLFILLCNYAGLVPGLMSPTTSINVTLGCAITTWVYYHLQGVKAQGAWGYLKHFMVPPGAHWTIGFVYFPIEIISHTSRVLSLSIRLFGNIFGEELVILILFSIIPFLVPLPMMFLGLVTASLQAFIFVLLTTIYLGGAVASSHEQEEHGEMAAGEV
jgi:F-type H+-transporting ATPase subunit a